jgi:hypothetical protein
MKNAERIQKIKKKVLKEVMTKKKEEQLYEWWDFMEEELTFPFKAVIQESENIELKWKDIVKVKNIEDFREPYGILVEIRKRKRKYIFPLCDLEIIDKQSKNHFITQAFLEWWTEKYW